MRRGFLLKKIPKQIKRTGSEVQIDDKKHDSPVQEKGPCAFDLGPSTIKLTEGIITFTSVPQAESDGDSRSECEWMANSSTTANLLKDPGFPTPIQVPRPDLCHVVSTPDMGLGVFAKTDIKRGELVISERPLVVAPFVVKPVDNRHREFPLPEYEKLMESLISRLSPGSQAEFKALGNAYPSNECGPLLGIMRTNNYSAPSLHDSRGFLGNYVTVGKLISRVNHSCIPNLHFRFDAGSFSAQMHALGDIKAGDQLFYCYCFISGTAEERKAELVPYAFVCKCRACANATPETDKLRSTFIAEIFRLKQLVDDKSKINEALLEEVLKFEEDLKQEGLDGQHGIELLFMVICAVYMKFGNVEKSVEYGRLAGIIGDDELN